MFPSRKNAQDIERNALFTSHISRLEQKDIEHAFARLFSTDDGKKVLAWLQVMTETSMRCFSVITIKTT